MTGVRRKARITALQALFEIDAVGHSPQLTIERLIIDNKLSANAASFAHELVNGVLLNKERLDTTIQKYAPAWPLKQVAIIDRNILRLAVFETVINNKVPRKAAINEAVELAKSFGSDTSPKFINGVLGTISNNINSIELVLKGD